MENPGTPGAQRQVPPGALFVGAQFFLTNLPWGSIDGGWSNCEGSTAQKPRWILAWWKTAFIGMAGWQLSLRARKRGSLGRWSLNGRRLEITLCKTGFGGDLCSFKNEVHCNLAQTKDRYKNTGNKTWKTFTEESSVFGFAFLKKCHHHHSWYLRHLQGLY